VKCTRYLAADRYRPVYISEHCIASVKTQVAVDEVGYRQNVWGVAPYVPWILYLSVQAFSAPATLGVTQDQWKWHHSIDRIRV